MISPRRFRLLAGLGGLLLMATGPGPSVARASEEAPAFLGIDPASLSAAQRALLVGPDTPTAPAPAPAAPRPAGRRIMINIPSRMLRIYEGETRILETPMAIGRRIYPGETGNTRTRIGSYRITSWHTDYHNRNYPARWSRDPWRGAFGKHTAKLGPRASYQYIHGTVGPEWLDSWLVEKLPPPAGGPASDRAVLAGEHGLSHGCVRVSNRMIERIKQLCPVGTKVEKFYCLTERVVLEDGTEEDLTLPDVYKYDLRDTSGVFYPATGRLEDYRGPRNAMGPR